MPPSKDDPRPNPLRVPGDYTTTATVHSDTYDAISPLHADMRGRRVFVSGGSRGLGRSIVLSFARAGASFIAAAARASPALTSLADDVAAAAKDAGREPPTFVAVDVDVTSVASVEGAAKKVGEAFGGQLDVVVNNAGIIESLGKRVTETDVDEWWKTWEVNVRGIYLVSRAMLPLLLARGEQGLRTLINVSSVGAHLLNPGLSAYQTGKLAVLRLTEFLAKEYEDSGVIAIASHPGNVPTEIFGEAGPREELKHIFVDTPELNADTLVWCCRDRREWLSGRYVNVTWDMPELEQRKEEIVSGDKLKVKLDIL